MEVSPQQICQDLLALLGRVKQEMLAIAEAEHLTQVQLGTLYMLDQYGDLAMGEVANMLHCDPSNVTGVVDRLVAQNLVSRQENKIDRRAKTISLLPAGKRIVDAAVAALPGRLGCSKLTGSERAVLRQTVQKIVD